MLNKLLSVFKEDASILDQNLLGLYMCLSMWVASIAFCGVYYIIGLDLWRILALLFISVAGLGAAYLFHLKKNIPAVLVQNSLMLFVVVLGIFFPGIGQQINSCLAIVAVFPVVFLERRHYGIVFINLMVCILILAASELLPRSSGPVSVAVYSFLLKFTVQMFIFFHVYALRIVLDRPRQA
ncbi:hypothetical protein [Bdellovibrio bacteriovorus]|uniref:hypothetical protein n=1 Tax=Bdellovibrio TaxID=958 RepID=UPI0035A85795